MFWILYDWSKAGLRLMIRKPVHHDKSLLLLACHMPGSVAKRNGLWRTREIHQRIQSGREKLLRPPEVNTLARMPQVVPLAQTQSEQPQPIGAACPSVHQGVSYPRSIPTMRSQFRSEEQLCRISFFLQNDKGWNSEIQLRFQDGRCRRLPLTAWQLTSLVQTGHPGRQRLVLLDQMPRTAQKDWRKDRSLHHQQRSHCRRYHGSHCKRTRFHQERAANRSCGSHK